jgi:polyketide cyclase/dehydrase/lipid transport protein
MGLNWAEHTVEIAAPIETCFGAITDYETFPSWQSAVVDTEVLDWDKQGRGKRVHLVVDAKVRKVDYTLDYRYDEPDRIEWDFVEGNGINDADGHYLFEDVGNGRTRATYKFGLEVGIPLPGPIARRAHRQTLKASVEDLKREAERRAGGEVGAAPAGREDTEVWTVPDSAPQSASGLPEELIGRATSLSRQVAGGAFRTTRGVAQGVTAAGFGAARGVVRTGIGAARTATDRAARIVGRGSDETEER